MEASWAKDTANRAESRTARKAGPQHRNGRTKMNNKALIPLVVGLAVGGIALKLGFDVIQRAKATPTGTVQLYSAREEIPIGVAIDEQALMAMPFPKDVRIEGAVTQKEKLVGRVPRLVVPKGVPITESMLTPPGSLPGIRVPAGFRAASVKIDESSGVDNHLQPGCFVDVVGVFVVKKDGRNRQIARTILENVQVAAVGQRLSPTSAEQTKDEKKGNAVRNARAVTLFCKPDQVTMLTLAEQKGRIKLSMRGPEDADLVKKHATVDEDEVLGLEKPEPEPAPSVADNENSGSIWARLFGSKPADEPEPVPAPLPQPDPMIEPASPQLAWVANVWNGAEQRVLGWVNFSDITPINLTGMEGDPTSPSRLAAPPMRQPAPRSPDPIRTPAPVAAPSPAPKVDAPDTDADMPPADEPMIDDIQQDAEPEEFEE